MRYPEEDKIYIYVPYQIKSTLDKDADYFEIHKSNSDEINKNGFLSMLLLGYYDRYIAETEEKTCKILSVLNRHCINGDDSIEIANELLQETMLPAPISKKDKNNQKLSLKTTKETSALISNIRWNLPDNSSLSRYLCGILSAYCEKPLYERERIIFKNEYDSLLKACSSGTDTYFSLKWNPKKHHKVIPYSLEVGKEELFNYFLCVEKNEATGKQEPRTYRLNGITNVISIGTKSIIPDNLKHLLDKTIQYGPQYVIKKEAESIIRLTGAGKNKFNRIYYGRPPYERIEIKSDGYYYHFRCSTEQLRLYFNRFDGNLFEIIAPEELKNDMLEFHRRGLS